MNRHACVCCSVQVVAAQDTGTPVGAKTAGALGQKATQVERRIVALEDMLAAPSPSSSSSSSSEEEAAETLEESAASAAVQGVGIVVAQPSAAQGAPAEQEVTVDAEAGEQPRQEEERVAALSAPAAGTAPTCAVLEPAGMEQAGMAGLAGLTLGQMGKRALAAGADEVMPLCRLLRAATNAPCRPCHMCSQLWAAAGNPPIDAVHATNADHPPT